MRHTYITGRKRDTKTKRVCIEKLEFSPSKENPLNTQLRPSRESVKYP